MATVRRRLGACAAGVVLGVTLLAGPAVAATYPPATPVPSAGSVEQQGAPSRSGSPVSVNSHLDVLGVQLPRTGLQAAAWTGVGLLLVGGGAAMSATARRARQH